MPPQRAHHISHLVSILSMHAGRPLRVDGFWPGFRPDRFPISCPYYQCMQAALFVLMASGQVLDPIASPPLALLSIHDSRLMESSRLPVIFPSRPLLPEPPIYPLSSPSHPHLLHFSNPPAHLWLQLSLFHAVFLPLNNRPQRRSMFVLTTTSGIIGLVRRRITIVGSYFLPIPCTPAAGKSVRLQLPHAREPAYIGLPPGHFLYPYPLHPSLSLSLSPHFLYFDFSFLDFVRMFNSVHILCSLVSRHDSLFVFPICPSDLNMQVIRRMDWQCHFVYLYHKVYDWPCHFVDLFCRNSWVQSSAGKFNCLTFNIPLG
jgi:hypothetical protein